MAASLKLSPHLKALINAPHALPSAISSPGRPALKSLFGKISSKGEKYGLDHQTWLTLSTAALVTVNSPESVNGLWDYAKSRGVDGGEAAAVGRRSTHRYPKLWADLISADAGDGTQVYLVLRCGSRRVCEACG